MLSSNLSDITIVNGHIRGGVTNNGSNVYNGSGFAEGIYFVGSQPVNVRVSGVSVSGCKHFGIWLGIGYSTVVESCTIRTVGTVGIDASTVKSSTVADCGGTAIFGEQVSDCRGYSTTVGLGIRADTVQNSLGASAGSGNGIQALTALNSYGGSGSGDGINARSAQNCYGSSDSGNGINVTETAMGCTGYTVSGKGLVARNASFCTVFRGGGTTGTSIQATIATGCYSQFGTNDITFKYNMP